MNKVLLTDSKGNQLRLLRVLDTDQSEYPFIRLFKTVFNTTPYEYIIQKRLAYSKELLLQNNSIQDIADIRSFADSASFCNAFKLAYGYTPKQFVKSN